MVFTLAMLSGFAVPDRHTCRSFEQVMLLTLEISLRPRDILVYSPLSQQVQARHIAVPTKGLNDRYLNDLIAAAASQDGSVLGVPRQTKRRALKCRGAGE